VFRNGQLLNNDQFNLTDTNKITIVSTSFKSGANYTVATVSGIGSVGSAQGDPVYPEAGIAVSTGTTWTTSIANNSNSWNIAFNDKINNAVFSGTDTKTLTLTQHDGGTFAPTFTDLQGVTGVTAGTGLTGGTITTTGTLLADTNFLVTRFDTSAMLANYLRSGVAASTYLPLTGGTLTGALNVNATSTLNFTNIYGKNTYVPFNVGLGEQSIFNVGSYLRGGTVMIFPDSSLAGSSGNLFFANSNVLGVEFSARGSGIRNYIKQGGDNNRNSLALYTSDIGQQNTNRLYINYNGDIGINDDTPSYKLEVNGTFNATGNITENGNNVLTSADTTTMLAPYIERGDTTTMLNPYWRSGKFSGTLPIANGGTNSSSASGARSNLNVDYLFLAITNGTFVGVNTNRVYIVNTGGSLTTQIDLTTDLTAGRTFMIKNLASGTIVSTASNVIPLNGGSASTPILGAGNATPQWCTLVCDGTNWHIIQRN
jgi:hypothetical protein